MPRAIATINCGLPRPHLYSVGSGAGRSRKLEHMLSPAREEVQHCVDSARCALLVNPSQ